jgi:hypothetical protein
MIGMVHRHGSKEGSFVITRLPSFVSDLKPPVVLRNCGQFIELLWTRTGYYSTEQMFFTKKYAFSPKKYSLRGVFN